MKAILQTCALENFLLFRWGAERKVPLAQTRERGLPSAQEEIGPSVVRATAKQTKVTTIFGIFLPHVTAIAKTQQGHNVGF